MIHSLASMIKQYRRLIVVLVAALFMFSCASQKEKIGSGAEEPRRISATGYTEFGCLVNLKDEARQQGVRLNPNDTGVEGSSFSWFFPLLNREGYQCSGSVLPPRRPYMGGDASLYPVN